LYVFTIDEGIFLGYYSNSKAYQYYNKRLKRVVDNVDVIVDEGAELISMARVQYPTYDDFVEGENKK